VDKLPGTLGNKSWYNRHPVCMDDGTKHIRPTGLDVRGWYGYCVVWDSICKSTIGLIWGLRLSLVTIFVKEGGGEVGRGCH
jgi:hypothetical protein